VDCEQLDTPDTTEFYARLKAARAQQRLPLAGSIELTFRCNLRCAHCYLGDQRSGDPRRNEMSTVEIKRVLDELCDAGCLWLLFTGGEPLVRADFLEIYRYARRKGFVVRFFTNGTLLTPQIADELAEYPPFLTEITLYGYTQATYERITGIPGSHARCLRGIDLLLERGLKLKLKTIAMSLNVHELPAMQEFADRLGIDFRYDPMVSAQLDGGKAPLSVRLSPEEIVNTELNNPKRVAEFQDISQRLGHIAINPNRLYSCLAGTSSFHIDPYGQLSPCMTARSQSYDLRKGSFEEGWNQFLPKVITQPRLAASQCEGCNLLAICGQCPAWSVLEHGNPNQKVDYLCQVAHLRAKTFGLNMQVGQ
jgi:radical SAM protein with 4Fe4S-binding SPASM domain